MGSGCDSVGRAVASYTRNPWFESNHRQTIYNVIYWQDKKKEKEAANVVFKKTLNRK